MSEAHKGAEREALLKAASALEDEYMAVAQGAKKPSRIALEPMVKAVQELRKAAEARAVSPQAPDGAEAQIAQLLTVMMMSAKCYVDSSDDDAVIGYRIKTAALNRIIGLLAGLGHPVSIPSNMPLAVDRAEAVAVIGSDYQLLYCRENWSESLKVGDKLYAAPLTRVAATMPLSVRDEIEKISQAAHSAHAVGGERHMMATLSDIAERLLAVHSMLAASPAAESKTLPHESEGARCPDCFGAGIYAKALVLPEPPDVKCTRCNGTGRARASGVVKGEAE